MLRIFRGERRSDPTAKSTDRTRAEEQPPESPEAQPPASTARAKPAAPGSNGHAAVPADGPPTTETPAAASQAAVEGVLAEQQPGAPAQGAAAGQAPPEEIPSDPGFLQRGRMRRRARFLRAARELAYRDLGGLMFDLHRFSQRNDEVMQAKLSTLSRIDSELRAIEEALRLRSPVTVLREAGVAACPRCAAIHGSDDRFCPACGLAVTQAERPIGAAPAPVPAPPTPIATPPFHQHLPPPMPIAAPQAPMQPSPYAPSPYAPSPYAPSPYAPSPYAPSPAQQPSTQPPRYAPPPASQPAVGAGPAPSPIRGAYPALPAAPATQLTGPLAPAAAPAPHPATPATHPATTPQTPPRRPEERQTEVVSREGADAGEQRTRAFDPIAPVDISRRGEREERHGP